MKRLSALLLVLVLLVMSCSGSLGGLFNKCPKEEKVCCGAKEMTNNPFFEEWNTPFGIPPFDKIQNEHYLSAYEKGIDEHAKELDAIANNPEFPTFENTLVALEKAGGLLDNVNKVFNNLNGAHTNDEMQVIAEKITPKLTAHFGSLWLNDKMFQRIKTLNDKKDDLNLNPEQQKLLKEYYTSFVRGGANLSPEDKDKLRKIDEELSMLTLKFGQNVLKEDNNYKIVLEEEDLTGLPENVVAAGKAVAEEQGLEGKYVYTVHRPSMYPFLENSERRDLREKLYRGYFMRGDNNNEFDNKENINKIVRLRIKRAKLLGYETHAEYILSEYMAKNADNVYELLNQLWKPAVQRAKEERAAMQEMIDKSGQEFKLESWDWWYYADKIKKEKYNLDENELKPYFKLENVRQGAFDVANKLFGITFIEIEDVPVYHPDVKAFEVKDADGTHIGVLLTDYYYRSSKRGGAWMNDFRKQNKVNGNVRPIIANTCNFPKPVGDTPSLLSLDNVTTLFHEFGHALHGLLSDGTYPSLTGTSVARDFVELPSQIMENWATQPEVLKTYAKHYETGEVIPDELIEKINKSAHFNQGFGTGEYLAASFLDMDFHTLTNADDLDVLAFEKESMDKIGLIQEIKPRYRSSYFRHIFAGGYSAGYYAYIWAEVLDKDGFAAFEESGDLFNPQYAEGFRKYVLETGGAYDPMEMYVKFRGREPEVDALLKGRGLK